MLKFNESKLKRNSSSNNIKKNAMRVLESGLYNITITESKLTIGGSWGDTLDLTGNIQGSDGTCISTKIFLTSRDGKESFGSYIVQSIMGAVGVDEIETGDELIGKEIFVAVMVTNNIGRNEEIKYTNHRILGVYNKDKKSYNEVKENLEAIDFKKFIDLDTEEKREENKKTKVYSSNDIDEEEVPF